MRLIIRVIFLVGVIVLVGIHGLSEEIYVTTTDNDGPGSLRSALNTANTNGENDTIYLPSGTYVLAGASGEDGNLVGDLDIDNDEDTNIVGDSAASTIIDGGGVDRVFHIINGEVSISNVTIQNGIAPDGPVGTQLQTARGASGGGILNYGYLLLQSCVISDNATGDGGANSCIIGNIYIARGGDGGGVCNHGTLSISDCRVANNVTGKGGIVHEVGVSYGAHGGRGGGVFNGGIILSRISRIENNQTGDGRSGDFDGDGGDGGGIFNDDGATATLFQCTIAGNVTGSGCESSGGSGSGGSGGGIYNEGTFSLARCTVSGNYTGDGFLYSGKGGYGGGILNTGTFDITNCTISGNWTGAGELGPSSLGMGGGIFNSDGVATLTSCTVYANVTGTVDLEWGRGGGIYNDSMVSGSSPILVLQNTIAAGNSSQTDGEGPDCYGAISSLGHNLIENTADCIISGTNTGNITGVDPLLENLSDNGGGTLTHALLSSSPCIDAGTSAGLWLDQRGGARPYDNILIANADDGSDIGAFERDTPVYGFFIDSYRLNFGAVAGNPNRVTPGQTFGISNSGGGTLTWRTEPGAAWLNCTPASGTGAAEITVTVDASGLAPGQYGSSVEVYADDAPNSPQYVSVSLIVYGTSQPPLGTVDTPLEGGTVSGAIPVTGWAIDDIGVESVKLYRSPVSGEGDTLIYLDNAVFVAGARPDIGNVYPDYPGWRNAGWGYMLLTNFFPGNGNGTFTLHAVARDVEGNEVTLGSKTIVCDNANATKPFGAIDTPRQGDVVSGSSYVNFGWALTRSPNKIPVDGSTITVWVDGQAVGSPVYNQYRNDIARLFPGYANSDGAGGHFYLDTTQYADGIHTISWSVTDDAGNTDGIGSRFFTVRNSGQSRAAVNRGINPGSVGARQISIPVSVRKGFNRDTQPVELFTGDDGELYIEIEELERLEIGFKPKAGGNALTRPTAAYLECNAGFLPLPPGSSLNKKECAFYWQPAAGFIGDYRFIFLVEPVQGKRLPPGVERYNKHRMEKISVWVRIIPKRHGKI